MSKFFGSMPTRHVAFIVGSSVASTLALMLISRLAFDKMTPQTIPSPTATLLPKLSEDEKDEMAYPPDVFPGARDVASPYGMIRVYEWGPEEGRKVLLVHGISTPCLAFGGIANGLVEKGCRVMLFDLWGRGYSDGVDLPHDSRLYTTEILIAITSSPLCWTGRGNGFNLIGYSLGGGISADFASCFPEMVLSLTLLAPAGLIRPHHFSWESRFLYSGCVPERLLQWIVRQRLHGPVHSTLHKKSEESTISEDVKGARDERFESAQLSKTRPGLTVGGAVQWQLENHKGFVNSFVSSIKYSSITGKQETWKKLGLRHDKVLIMAGSTDPVIVPAELHTDALASIGPEHVECKVIEGGHEFPITQAVEVVDQLSKHWSL